MLNKPNTLRSIITLFLFLPSVAKHPRASIPAKTVQVNQQAEQQLVLPFNVWRGRGGPGYVEVFIAVWGRER